MNNNIFEKKLTQEDIKTLHKERESNSDIRENLKAKGLRSSLAEFSPTASAPWDSKRAKHLMRRLRFGASYSEIEPYLDSSAGSIVKEALDSAQNGQLPSQPEWYNKYPPPQGSSQAEFVQYFEENFDLVLEYQQDWVREMFENPFREKMVLFWHDHFATEQMKYELAPFAARHFTVLRENCLGNFKDLVYKIGKDHAMLIYLDSVENRNGSPNENYARELLELFTMGIGNYSQNDITDISRALTGFYVNFFNFDAGFYSGFHDTGEKTFFGRTGNFGYDDVIDIIFEERADEIAEFVCSKLYRFFLYETPNPSIVSELADIFKSNNFEIRPVVETLLKSEHFFDQELMGAMFKSPVDYLLGMYAENDLLPNEEFSEIQPYLFFVMEQFLFNPPNVAGWPGYRSWLSTTTLPYRWIVAEYVGYYSSANSSDPYKVDPIAIANKFEDPNDPYKLSYDLAEFLLPVDLPEEELTKLSDVLLGGLPDYEWNLGFQGAAGRILNLIVHIRKLPEYQLM